LKNSSVSMKKQTSTYYSNELIELFLSVSYKSSMAYLTALTLFTIVFVPYIPTVLFYVLVSAHIGYQMVRFYYTFHYKKVIFTEQLKIEFVKRHTLLMLVGGSTWGVSCGVAVFYAPPAYEYAMLVLIVSMVAGSLSTLSAIYRTYVAFNIPMISAIILSFILSEGELNAYIALILPIFSYVIMTASWEMHKSLKRSLELKELYAASQEELQEINNSLEEKVEQEVNKNRKKDQQMLAQSRLAQMGEMLSMIAHQWRQPLSAITATTGNMSMHLHLDQCDTKLVSENLDKINTYTQYLSTTINDFRDFFKPDRKEEEMYLDEIVMGSLNIIGPSLQSDGIEIKTDLNALEKIHSYPNELKQVILNLLKNSKDIYMEHKTENKKIEVKTYIKDENVVLEVIDEAGGVKEKDIPFIFDPYFTTKEKRDGTGLGLYMSKLIIEEHCNGKLYLENREKGACFRFVLPM